MSLSGWTFVDTGHRSKVTDFAKHIFEHNLIQLKCHVG